MQNFGAKRTQNAGFGKKVAAAGLFFGSKIAKGVSRVARTAADVGNGVLSVADWIPGAGLITGPGRAATKAARIVADGAGAIGGIMDFGAKALARDGLERGT